MALLNRLKIGLLAGLAGLVMACGSGDGGDGPKPGCLKDADCKGNRICVEGTCVASEEPDQDIYVPEKDTVSEDNYQPNCKSHAEKVCSGDELLWYDSCGNLEEKSESCDYGCSNGKCQAPGCESHAGTVCSDGDVYWKDSCGNLEDKSKSCDNGCSNGKCQGQTCNPHENKVCSNGDVYWQDSCGALEEKSESCDYDCDNGICQEQTCEPHTNAICFEDDVYWKNSCGDLEEKLESCDYGCSNGECLNKSCTDECASDENKCEKQDLYHCLDTNEDGCLEWSLAGNCVKDGSGSNFCMNGNYYCDPMPIGCDDGESLPSFQAVCDGVEDCSDGSDENSCYLCQNNTNSCSDIVDCTNNAKGMLEHFFNLCICQSDDTSIQKFFELYACAFSNCGGVSGITQSCLDEVMSNECSYALNDCINDN